jgi:hypothetical protein
VSFSATGRETRFAQLTGEVSAILGAAYESFLRTRLERRAGRAGKGPARAFVSVIEMVSEMIEEAVGREPEMLWQMAVIELDRDRGEIEADVLAQHGHVVFEHEWGAFLAYVEQLRAPSARS